MKNNPPEKLPEREGGGSNIPKGCLYSDTMTILAVAN
jgi:hypothetical protein